MVLFFFTLSLIISIIFIILNSSFKLSINKLCINTENKQIDYELKIGLYFMKKIRIIGIKLNKQKIVKIKRKIKRIDNSKILKKLSKINIEKISSKLTKKIRVEIKKNKLKPIKIVEIILENIKIETLKYNMTLKIGLEDAFVTSILIASISTIISIILKLTAKNINKNNNYYYKVTPIYCNKNIFKLNLNCIINLKLVHIINILYIVYKKGRSDKYVRTSNRKPYDYCHE